MIKDVLVALSSAGKRDPAADYAISLASAFEAHLSSLAFAYEAVLPPTVMGGIPANFIDSQRVESEKTAQGAIARFEEGARRAGIAVESHVLNGTLSRVGDSFGRLARRFDLVVVGQSTPEGSGAEALIIEAALFESGRPVIVVPYIQKAGLALDQVMVCWDGSRTAARAIADAVPILCRAKAVELVMVMNDRVAPSTLPGVDMARHLARHGLKVEVKRIGAGDLDTPNTLLSHAADISADFIVMGGYGHSRLREFVLGGVTRTLLNSMTVPVLMSH